MVVHGAAVGDGEQPGPQIVGPAHARVCGERLRPCLLRHVIPTVRSGQGMREPRDLAPVRVDEFLERGQPHDLDNARASRGVSEQCEDGAVSLPRVIAHRGASAHEAENSLRAYELALEHGADGIETDLRLSADRHLICTHDRRLDRTTSARGSVSAMTLAELGAVEWGVGPGLAEHIRENGPQEVLTLDGLLDAIRDDERDAPLLTLLETKHPNRFRGQVEAVLAGRLHERGLTHGPAHGLEVVVMSFLHTALGRMRRLAPQVPLVYLIELGMPSVSFDGSLPAGVTRVGLDVRYLRTPKVVRAFQRRGHQVYVWTVDEPDDVQRCLDLGVDVIISNRPLAVRAQVHGH